MLLSVEQSSHDDEDFGNEIIRMYILMRSSKVRERSKNYMEKEEDKKEIKCINISAIFSSSSTNPSFEN